MERRIKKDCRFWDDKWEVCEFYTDCKCSHEDEQQACINYEEKTKEDYE